MEKAAFANGYEFTQGSGYALPEYPFVEPPEIASGEVTRHAIVIVGGGITGLTLACSLARLEADGFEVLGVTDHHIFKSIYFFDPIGVRLELTAQLADEFEMLQEGKTARKRLDEWTARKEQWRADRALGVVAG